VAPDFNKIASAYGVTNRKLDKNADSRKFIKEALAFDGPLVCDIDCGDWYAYEPRVFGWNTPIEDMYPYIPRDEFRKNMIIDPVVGWENPPLPGGGPKVKKIESHE
jgi:acetolactate synthase-1/2/3 large subunit